MATSQLSTTDQEYFASYEDVESHEIMLKDVPRGRAYLKALESVNLTDLVILDLGCGPAAFLSLMAARSGAKKIYAVEASEMANNAEAIVQHNGYSDIIQVIKGRVEDLELPEKVDLIVSEWMGFYLLHESMLASVLNARDRFLKPGGMMFPTTATIYACPVSMEKYYEEKFTFWEDVEGFDLSGLMPLAMARAMSQPLITVLEPKQLISQPLVVAKINCKEITPKELVTLEAELEFIVEQEGNFHGMAIWFDVEFQADRPNPQAKKGSDSGTKEKPESKSKGKGKSKAKGNAAKGKQDDDHDHDENNEQTSVLLSTAPNAVATHWKQTVILFPQILSAEKDQTIRSRISLVVNEQNHRRYNLTVDLENEEEDEDMEFDEMETDPDAYNALLQACLKQTETTEADEN